MQRVNLIDMYELPASYRPPPTDQLATDTQFPNLNSLDYQTRPAAEASRSRKYFEHLAVNEAGNAVLVANRYTDRVWHSHFWGFRSVDAVHGNVSDVLSANDDVAYRLRCKATITGVRYVEENMLLVSDTAGTLTLWSTQSAARSPAYCLFNVGQQSEHTGGISALDVCAAQRTTAITGSTDGCIKCWDLGEGDLFSTQTYRSAHGHTVSALSTSPREADLFASASLDGTVQLWDRREALRPIVAIGEQSAGIGLTALQWHAGAADRLYVGDVTGSVHCVDVRRLGVFERTWRPFARDAATALGHNGGGGSSVATGRVHRLRFDANQRRLAVVADSTVVKVLDVSVENNGCNGDVSDTTATAVVFETPRSADFVRDVHWPGVEAAGTDAGEYLYTIGWAAALTKHKIA